MKSKCTLYFIALGMLYTFSFCQKCEECIIKDSNGTELGTTKLCGQELDEAKSDSLYSCP